MKRLLCLLGLLLTSTAQSFAAPPPVDTDFDRYATQAKLVALPGGRILNLDCRGTGGPTVLLLAGLTGWSERWVKVHDKLAVHHRVCAFDAAGFGYSGPSSEPQDTVHIVADLEAALIAAKITGPYVVIGHWRPPKVNCIINRYNKFSVLSIFVTR
jgi:pimeloyl-ACP methyl ester carboxylesterase